MAWILNAGKETLCHIKDAKGSVSLRSERYKGHEVKLKRIEAHTAECQLGVRIAMDGFDLAKYEHRLLQSRLFAGKIASSPFNRLDAETIYRERWIASVGQCLPITQFTDIQCNKIQSPFMSEIIVKMGFNRNFPRAVLFGL